MLITCDPYCIFSHYHLIKGGFAVAVCGGCLGSKGPPDPGVSSKLTLLYHHAKTVFVFSTLLVFVH